MFVGTGNLTGQWRTSYLDRIKCGSFYRPVNFQTWPKNKIGQLQVPRVWSGCVVHILIILTSSNQFQPKNHRHGYFAQTNIRKNSRFWTFQDRLFDWLDWTLLEPYELPVAQLTGSKPEAHTEKRIKKIQNFQNCHCHLGESFYKQRTWVRLIFQKIF